MTMPTLTLQKALAHLGFSPGRIDGVYGPATDDAVGRWGNAFHAQYGVWPRLDTAGRTIESITPPGAEAALLAAARAYDRTRATPDDAPETPRSSSSSSGVGIAIGFALVAGWLFWGRR